MDYQTENQEPVAVEQMVRDDRKNRPLIIKIAIIWLGVFLASVAYLLCFLYVSFPAALLSALAVAVLTALAFRMARRRVEVEYEYLFTDGLFSVSRIICRSDRELLCEFSCEDVVLMAPVTGTHIRLLDETSKNVIHAIPSPELSGRWFIVFTRGRERCRLMLLPNQPLLDAFRSSLPRDKWDEQ